MSTGKVQTYERAKSEVPEGALDLLAIPGIGPKTAMLIGTELGISTVEGVEQAAADGRLATLPRMGKRAADSIPAPTSKPPVAWAVAPPSATPCPPPSRSWPPCATTTPTLPC